MTHRDAEAAGHDDPDGSTKSPSSPALSGADVAADARSWDLRRARLAEVEELVDAHGLALEEFGYRWDRTFGMGEPKWHYVSSPADDAWGYAEQLVPKSVLADVAAASRHDGHAAALAEVGALAEQISGLPSPHHPGSVAAEIWNEALAAASSALTRALTGQSERIGE